VASTYHAVRVSRYAAMRVVCLLTEHWGWRVIEDRFEEYFTMDHECP